MRIILTCLIIVASIALSATTSTAQQFGEYKNAPADITSEVQRTSFYIPMRDGTRIAVDRFMPTVETDLKLPALVNMTRYWRRADQGGVVSENNKSKLDPLSEEVIFARRGYVVFAVDVRGTGASFGKHIGPWSPVEVQDGFDLCEWIVSQPWSNKRIGSYGISYGGTSAALLAATGHESVKVVIPTFNEFDIYRDIAYPGGVFNEQFVMIWSAINESLDHNQGTEQIFGAKLAGPAPVDADTNRALVQLAIAAHQSNPGVYDLARKAIYRDDTMAGKNSDDEWTFEDRSIKHYASKIRESNAFVYAWGSWMDAGTAPAVLSELAAFAPHVRAVIGPWSHGAEHHASSFLPAETRTAGGGVTMNIAWLRAFDYFLKDVPNGFLETAPLCYYTMGTETWKRAETWPIRDEANGKISPWFFKSDYQLGRLKTAIEKRPLLNHSVDFTASTGTNNRWFTQLDNDVVYPTNDEQSRKRLCFTSQPLSESYEITGTPIVRIKMSSSSRQNRVAAYLEAISTRGEVIYLTEGHLDLRHRGSTEASSANRTFSRPDAVAYTPGEQMEFDVSLLPTSVVLRPGYRLRVSLAGHDAETFARIPAEGKVEWQIEMDSSFIRLPMKLRRDLAVADLPDVLASYNGKFEFASGAEVSVSHRNDLLVVAPENATGLRLLEQDKNRFAECDRLVEQLIKSIRDSSATAMDPENIFAKHSHREEATAAIKQAGEVVLVGTMDKGGIPITILRLNIGGEVMFGNLIWTPANWKVMAIGSRERNLAERRFLPQDRTMFTAIDGARPSSISFGTKEVGNNRPSIRINGQLGYAK